MSKPVHCVNCENGVVSLTPCGYICNNCGYVFNYFQTLSMVDLTEVEIEKFEQGQSPTEFEESVTGESLRAFFDSPDAGDPACLCSRCGLVIPEEEAPILRIFTQIPTGETVEIRFHEACIPESLGIKMGEKSSMDFDDFRELPG